MKQRYTGTSATELAGGSSRSKKGEALPAYPFYALCVESGEYDIFLRKGRPYKVLRPHQRDPDSMFRVIDEEGEDYLYPRSWFVPVELKPQQKRRLAAALEASNGLNE